MKGILTATFMLVSSMLYAQGFTYSYVDPCTKVLKTVQIPQGQNSITVNYFGNVQQFTSNDFSNGTFDNWVNVISQANSSSPCDEVTAFVQTSTNSIITQNIIATLTNITSAAAMVSQNMAGISSNSMGSALANGTSNSQSGRSNSNQNNSNSNNSSSSASGSVGSSSGNSSGSGSSGSSSSGSSGSGSGSGGSGSSGSSSSGSSGSGSGGSGSSGSGETQQGSGDIAGAGSGGGSGGTTNSVANAAEAGSGEGSGSGGSKSKENRNKVGSMIGTGDIVAIRSTDSEEGDQLKGTFSFTKSNTNNTRASGILANFTTNINNSNVTLYLALNKGKGTGIFANSSMLDFDKNIFNTTTAMYSRRFNKFSVLGGVNGTIGRIGESGFQNISAVGGAFYSAKVSKKISATTLVLAVYSPFTLFYEGKWWNSSTLIVPFSSWDYTISKSFKFNVSFAGTYELEGSFLNYQVLTGGKILFN